MDFSKPKTGLANWKVTRPTLKQVNILCAHKEITQAVLADQALDALENKGPIEHVEGLAHAGRPVHFRSDEERRIVTAVLMAMRDPELCPIHLPVLKALLAEELRKIPKAKSTQEEKEGAA